MALRGVILGVIASITGTYGGLERKHGKETYAIAPQMSRVLDLLLLLLLLSPIIIILIIGKVYKVVFMMLNIRLCIRGVFMRVLTL